MSVLTFDGLIHRLQNELHRLHFAEGSIAGYRSAWKHIASFLDYEGLPGFSEEAGPRFLDTKYSFSELEKRGA